MYTLDGTLETMAPLIPRDLVGPAARDRIRATCAALPAGLSNRLYLECRGDDGGARVDLIISVDGRGRSLLVEGVTATAIDHPNSAPVWSAARALARAWCKKANPLYRIVRRLWLEFDLDPASAWREAIAEPGMFIDFSAEIYLDPSPTRRLDAALLALTPLQNISAGVAASLARCVGALAGDGRLVYVGVFPGRGGAGLRVCIHGLTNDRLGAYLDVVGWPGTSGSLARLLEPLAAHPDSRGGAVTLLHLDLETDGGIAPRIGVERTFDRECQRHGRINDAAILDALVRSGYCEASQRRALLAWPGCTVRTLPHELWPSVIVRRVNHVKLVGGDDADPIAKIYLCATHRYHDRRPEHARLDADVPTARAETRLASTK